MGGRRAAPGGHGGLFYNRRAGSVSANPSGSSHRPRCNGARLLLLRRAHSIEIPTCTTPWIWSQCAVPASLLATAFFLAPDHLWSRAPARAPAGWALFFFFWHNAIFLDCAF